MLFQCKKFGLCWLLILFVFLVTGPPARAQGILLPQNDDPATLANGALAILGFSVVPNETASTMNVDAGGGDVRFNASQLGGAFTVSDSFPLYLEGFAGVARYDPRFVFSNGARTAVVAPRWTSIAGTVGVGWDFPITDRIVFRPIANFSLGHIESDLSLAGRFLSSETGVELEFLENGRLNAVGYGGAAMLDYELYREAYEVDVELRYTHIRLQSISGTSEAARATADAITLGLWSRLRVPTGYEAFGGPIRAVGELAGSSFLGDQTAIMKTPWLGQIGAGIEFDTTTVSWHPVYRTRLMARYLIGDNLSGFSFGLAVTF
jgi:hypothetical protein